LGVADAQYGGIQIRQSPFDAHFQFPMGYNERAQNMAVFMFVRVTNILRDCTVIHQCRNILRRELLLQCACTVRQALIFFYVPHLTASPAPPQAEFNM
jgi:hypothetical protein